MPTNRRCGLFFVNSKPPANQTGLAVEVVIPTRSPVRATEIDSERVGGSVRLYSKHPLATIFNIV